MADGATLVAPETVWFAWDTEIGRDVTIEQNVVFGPGVTHRRRGHDPRVLPSRGRARGLGRDHRPLRAAAPRRRARGRGRTSAISSRSRTSHVMARRQGQSPDLSRRRRGRRGRQHRRGHDHLQLRRLLQVSHGDRRARVRRLEQRAGRAGQDRRRRDRRRRAARFRATSPTASCGWCARSSWSSPAGPTSSTT